MLEAVRTALAGTVPGGAPTMSDLMGPRSTQIDRIIGEERHPAAVLVGLVLRDNEPRVLLTERSKDLRSHPGQVSFPGGRVEAGDPDAWAAAAREANEEIGLPETHIVERLGYLETYLTVTGFLVTPVVALLHDDFTPIPDGFEVDEVFEVPLGFLFDAENLTVTYRERLGTRFRVYEYLYEGHRIWGATAAMLVGMRRQVLGLPEPK